jgi:hypothetical protein
MNNLYKNLKVLASITILATYVSCETIDYEGTNDDPSGPLTPVTSQLLTNAIANGANSDANQRGIPYIINDVTPMLYMQQITQGQYPGASRYNVLTFNYDDWYTGPLQNLNEIISINEDPETAVSAISYGDNNNQIAVAKILKAYYLQYMTDYWGALPLSEAFMGIDNPQPVFDTQESIYNFLFAEIEEALELADTDAPGPDGDILFSGNMQQWLVFANNLKLTMALRISHVSPTLAKSKFEEAVASGMLITSNEDNIEYHYGTDDISDSPWSDRFKTREDYILSRTMVESLRENLDPRLFEFAEPARDSISPVTNFPGGIDAGYVGAPNGRVNGNVPSYSFIKSEIIYTVDFPTPIYTAGQINLSLAEAALNGWNVGGSSAETLYETGITASMEYWGVSDEDITAYIEEHPFVGINDIAYEKWVALYLNGSEAWAEWRRLDWPILIPSEEANDKRIPVRNAYDASISDNNSVNYEAMVSFQGLDNLHTKLWWDVN